MVISIPLYVLLFTFFLFLLILAVFYAINIAHIVATANMTLATFVVTFIVLALATLTIYGTWFYTQETDWKQPVKIWDNSWLGSNSLTY